MPGIIRPSRKPKHRAGLLESLQLGEAHNFVSAECFRDEALPRQRASPLLKLKSNETTRQQQTQPAAGRRVAEGAKVQHGEGPGQQASSVAEAAVQPAQRQGGWPVYDLPVDLQLDLRQQPVPETSEAQPAEGPPPDRQQRRRGFCNDDLVVPPVVPPIPSASLPPETEPAADAAERTDLIALRMLNLPVVVCNSANGMPYFLPLQRVQEVVASQVIGEASMKEAHRMKNRLLGAPMRLAAYHPKPIKTRHWTKLRRKVSCTPADQLRTQLRHTNATEEYAHRAMRRTSQSDRSGRATGDFGGRGHRGSITGKLPGSTDRRKTRDADFKAARRASLSGRGSLETPLPEPTDGPQSHRSRATFAENLEHVHSFKAATTPAGGLSPQPKLGHTDWGETFLRASSDPETVASQLDVREYADLQRHWEEGKVEHEGGSVYEQKCRELGTAALSAVIACLEKQHANLSHCCLGSRGAHALGHALACNLVIDQLTLAANNIDGEATGHIVRGIMAGLGNIHGQQYSEKARMQHRMHKVAESVVRTSSVVPEREDLERRMQGRQESTAGCISKLSISDNAIGSVGARYIADLINPEVCRHQQITVLKLSKCEIADNGGIVLARALANNNVLLKELDLSKNKMSNGTAAAFGELLRYNQTLTRLDLAWNNIKASGARELSKGLENNARLQNLSLAWNGLENEGCIAVAQMLEHNVGLKEVDLSCTRMGPAACVVLAEALKENGTLSALLLHGNPLGAAGGCYIMTALASNHHLEYIGLQGANFVSTDSDGQAASAVSSFNPAHPEGSYVLDLGLPAERAIAVMLANLDASSPADPIKNIRINGKPVSGSAKKLGWPDKLPSSGALALDVVVVKHRRQMAVIDPQRLRIFIANLSKQRISDSERLKVVGLFAPYNYFTCGQCDAILRTFGMGDEKIMAALVLFARAVDHANIDELTASFYERDLKKFYADLGILAVFRPENASGHYELSLTLPHHRNIAHRLSDLAAAEGDALTWRNLAWEDFTSHANAGPPDHWRGQVPNKGTLYFDYVSMERPAPGTSPVADDELQALLTEVGLETTTGAPTPSRTSPLCTTQAFDTFRSSQDSGFSPADAVICNLRVLSPQICVSIAQLKGILALIKAPAERVEAVVTFYPRLVEPDELWLVLYSLKGLEQSLVMMRLGLRTTFNPRRCSLHFQLDVSNPEHGEVARKLVDMAMKAPEQRNFYNIRIFGKVKSIPENNTMWAVMTTSSVTPYLEFDFLAADALELLGFSEEKAAAMQQSEKADTLTKYAAKLENIRLKQMHPFFSSDSEEPSAPVATTRRLTHMLSSPIERMNSEGRLAVHASPAAEPAAHKMPWAASWERNMRRLIGLDGALVSPLHEIFNSYAQDQPRMTTEQLKAALLAHGYSRAEASLAEQALNRMIATADEDAAALLDSLNSPKSPKHAGDTDPGSEASHSGSAGVLPSPRTGAQSANAAQAVMSFRPTRSGASTARDSGITYEQFEQVWLMEHNAIMRTVVRNVQNIDLRRTLGRGSLTGQSPQTDTEPGAEHLAG